MIQSTVERHRLCDKAQPGNAATEAQFSALRVSLGPAIRRYARTSHSRRFFTMVQQGNSVRVVDGRARLSTDQLAESFQPSTKFAAVPGSGRPLTVRAVF